MLSPRRVDRFFGWHYAKAAHQDTAKWVKKAVPATPKAARFPSNADAANSQRIVPSISGKSFPFAGFASSAKLPSGYLPTSVVQGDFNQDGKMDIAISNGGENTIYVLLGNGDGTFKIPEVLFTKGQAPVWIASAKLRASGHLDLIVADGDSNEVEVFSGMGDGTFQPSSVVAKLSQAPSYILTGDFNKDGHTDLAVGLVVDPYSIEPQFTILEGDGSGSFPTNISPPPVDNSSNSGPLPTDGLVVGDINNDGQLDLVATVAFGGAVTYLNQSGTSFHQGTVFGPSDGMIAVTLGDMNSDGCLDAIETGGYGFVTIAKGNCDGTFSQSSPTAEIGDIDVAVEAIDVNGDGKLDVVASSAFSDNEVLGGIGAFGGYLVSVLDGDGAGNLGLAQIYRVGPDAYSLLVSDLNGDNRPDILTISQTENTTCLLINDGNGGFGSPFGGTLGYLSGVTNAPIPSSTPQTVDLNGDGKPDVLLMEFGTYSSVPSEITALLNDGTGKLSAPVRTPISVGPNDPYPIFTAGAFRSSTTADLIYVSTYESPLVAFFPGKGDGTFGTPVTLATLPNPYRVVSGDFNKDGKLDFAVFGYTSFDSFATTELDVFLGSGDGTFKQLAPQTFAALTSAFPQQLIAGDFNHDGKLDLLIGYNANSGWVTSGDDLDLLTGNGDGAFQTPTTLMPHFGPVAVADLNHDGYLDLIQSRDPEANVTDSALTAAGGAYIATAATVYLGGPNGMFTKNATYFGPGVQIPSFSPALVGDFNGDGKFDIAIPYDQSTEQRPWERRLQIFQGNGDGSFSVSGIPYQLPAYDSPMIGGDYRGLGVTDLLDLVGATSSINTISAAPAPPLMLVADSSPLTESKGSATVTLALPATSGQTVQLGSSDPAVSLPAALTFSQGQMQQSFSFTLGPGYDSSHLLALSATLNGQIEKAYLTVANSNLKPNVVASVGASVGGTSSVSTTAGTSVPLIFTLQSVAGYSGTFDHFTCSGLPAGASCNFALSNILLLPGGSTQVAFELDTASATPGGTYNLSISASNGELTPSAPLAFDVGGIAIGVNPAVVVINGPNPPTTTVSANFTNGLNLSIQIACNGLPAGAGCEIPGVLYPASPSETVTVAGATNLPPQDYPFTIVGSVNNVTQSASATLRVTSFTATLDKNSASLSTGQSATFNVTLTSLNHFSNSSVSFTCLSVTGITCTTTPQYVALADGGTATAALKITYSGSAANAQQPPSSIGKLPIALGCITLVLLPLGSRTSLRRKAFMIATALLLFASVTACGGGGGQGRGTPPPSSKTISITVNAQAPVASGTLQAAADTITLTLSQ